MHLDLPKSTRVVDLIRFANSQGKRLVWKQEGFRYRAHLEDAANDQHLLLLVSALACVWWIARNPEDHIMLTLKASANDIERALNELHHTASTGTSSDARHAGNFLLALWDSDHFPLHLQDFQYLNPALMRQPCSCWPF